jgi:hypothetical protein
MKRYLLAIAYFIAGGSREPTLIKKAQKLLVGKILPPSTRSITLSIWL